MSRVLVTGARGFIGRHSLPRLLASGHEVHAVSRSVEPPQEGLTWHRADLLDPASTSALVATVAPTHLLHLAWDTSPGFWTSPANLDWTAASLRLVREFTAHGGRRLVVAGTCAEYAWGDAPCLEGVTALAPSTLYGASKASLAAVLEAYARTADLSLAWGRLFFLYGPAERSERLVPSIVTALLRGEPARCTAGRQVRDFLDARDAGDALAAMLVGDIVGPVNVASGTAVPIAHVAELLGKLLGRPNLIQLGALPDRPDDPPVIAAEVSRLRDELGWKPAYPLEAGLGHTAAWWRDELKRAANRADEASENPVQA